MATRTFDLHTTVTVAPAAAIDFLVQLDRHRGLHPYVQSAERTGRGTDAEGEWTDWLITERPRWGPFRYRIRFPTRTTRTSATSFVSRVRAAPGCTLLITTEAVATDSGTRVAETVAVSAPLPLVGYMHRQARLAHTRMYSLLSGELRGASA